MNWRYNNNNGDITTRVPVGETISSEHVWLYASQHPNYQVLQDAIRKTKTLSQPELYDAKQAIGQAELTEQELLTLENIARNRAVSNERMQGWAGGIWDLVQYLEYIRTTRQAA